MDQTLATDAPNEQELTEEDIPRLASRAGRLAYERALAAGKSVVIAQGGVIFRVFPDGRKQVLKQIAARIASVPGKKYRIP